MFARLALLIGLTCLPLSALAGQVTVFAASSLTGALEETGTAWRKETGHDLRLVLGGSSALARQIAQGAPADIFISANSEWMDVLDQEGLIRTDSRIDLLGNALVLVAPATMDLGTADLGNAGWFLKALGPDGRLAMALIDAVPAGIYGKAALSTLGVWDQIAPRVAQSDNVRGALALVATGEAPLGIVYATDAKADARVQSVATFGAGTHSPITYPTAIVSDSQSDIAASFMEFLQGSVASEIFESHGFIPKVAQ